MIIEDARNLRNVVAPAISIATTVRMAGEDAQKAAERHQAIRRFTNASVLQLAEQTKATNQTLQNMMGQTTIGPETLHGRFGSAAASAIEDLVRETPQLERQDSER